MASDERRALRPTIIDANQFYSIEEAAAARDQSRTMLYEDIAAGRLRVVKHGKRVKVFGAELIRLNQLEAQVTARVSSSPREVCVPGTPSS